MMIEVCIIEDPNHEPSEWTYVVQIDEEHYEVYINGTYMEVIHKATYYKHEPFRRNGATPVPRLMATAAALEKHLELGF